MVHVGILLFRYLEGGAVSDQDEALKVSLCIYNGADSGPIITLIVVLPIGITTTYLILVVLIRPPTGTYTGLHTGYRNRCTEKDDTYS